MRHYDRTDKKIMKNMKLIVTINTERKSRIHR